ncbi:lipopolysaccharide-induced tumor necrosis factor-alpha factor homolog [Folsomia candida]|uniref:lipopolysaccharide-induced tumor necrosis factor-alpha factor homolog n=1 Tax=Folsomia candida TaxID=158441 RepID=UPI000B8FCB5E|nr:lipopolysaccharide-induced tumor necrosis factor-alpha factor homolog [Folsomia candida]
MATGPPPQYSFANPEDSGNTTFQEKNAVTTQVQPLLVAPVRVVRLPDHFTAAPMNITCNVCHAQIRTMTEESCNPICCIIWGICALCCCQDVEHKCPNCNAFLGKYDAAKC